jgi:serine/threonine-protein kinase HipA
MARTLDVYLHRQLCGRLFQDDRGHTSFAYAEEWLANPNASALSQSLPLRRQPFERNECGGFFGGILPEQGQREKVAKNLGISARNDFAMLERIGGECAGAVTFISSGMGLPVDEHDYRALTSNELAEAIRLLPRRPLLAGQEGVRLSLAGAQSKLAVYVDGDTISVPLGGAPSTHILKPAIPHFEGIVSNEAFCMRLAKAIGLKTADVQDRQVEGLEYILVERYDRETSNGPPVVRRLHQEDFCQALGIDSESKYQSEGGPSFKQCFDLLRRASSTPVIDLQALLDAVIFNYLIGNHDAHGKNFSLLYTSERRTSLAPLYDLVCTTYYPNLSKRMAMKIGGEYDSEKILGRHFVKLAEETGLSKALVVRRVSEMMKLLLDRMPMLESGPVSVQVAQVIRNQCERAVRRLALAES